MAIRKVGAPMSRARLPPMKRTAAKKAEPPSLVPAGTSPALNWTELVGSRVRGRYAVSEVPIILPEAMHNDGEFARHCHSCST